MNNFSFSVGGISVCLEFDDGCAETFSQQYGGFSDDSPEFLFHVEKRSEDIHSAREPPRLLSEQPALQIVSPGAFELNLDRGSKTGRITFAANRADHLPGRPPAGLHAAMKSVVAIMLAERDGFLLHASGVILNDVGIAFLGKSGSGKSTVCEMFETPSILNDELVAVTVRNGKATIHGTPFSGTADSPRSEGHAPLLFGFGLGKTSGTRVVPLSLASGLSLMLTCIAIPNGNHDLERKLLDSATRVSQQISWRKLEFDLASTSVVGVVDATLRMAN